MPKRKSGAVKNGATAKQDAKPESEAARFDRVAEQMRQENTKSPEAARAALIKLGILDSDGQLSDNYK